MKKIFAIILCKILHFMGKLTGRGSSLPGKAALGICRDILGRIELPDRIIAVTGSNGKTSTVEMIAAVLKGRGIKVVWNQEGANQIEGIVTLALSHASLGGRVKGDVFLIEVDERYAAKIFKYLCPTQLVVTNLCRDQLTRNRHPEKVYENILSAVRPQTELMLNADDPLSSCLARGRGKVKWFGVEKCSVSADHPTGAYHDGAYCPVCKGPMEYDYVNYNHIGSYRCPRCGHARPRPDYLGASVNLENGYLTTGSGVRIRLSLRSIYHGYNALTAWAVCCNAGIPGEAAASILSCHRLKNGRVQPFTLGSHRGMLLTSKHENSIAYDTNLHYIASSERDCVVLIIVDAVSRKYFTCETSWLWDIDFDQLNQLHVKKIILSGRYCKDLAECFSFTDLHNWSVQPDICRAVAGIGTRGSEDVYAVTCFSDRDKLLAQVERH